MSHKLNHTFQKRDILQPDVNGFVEEKFLRYTLVEELRNSKLSGFMPVDSAQYDIFSGAPEEWAEYFVATAKSSSGINAFKINYIVKYDKDGNRIDVERVGLYGIDPTLVIPNKEQLLIPIVNIKEAVRLYAAQIIKDRAIAPSDLDNDGALEEGFNLA